MQPLLWASRLVLFLLLFGFAIKNTELVSVRFFLGISWQTPLIVVVLLSFALGAALAVASLLGSLAGLRREISRLEDALRASPAPGSARRATRTTGPGATPADGEIGQ